MYICIRTCNFALFYDLTHMHTHNSSIASVYDILHESAQRYV